MIPKSRVRRTRRSWWILCSYYHHCSSSSSYPHYSIQSCHCRTTMDMGLAAAAMGLDSVLGWVPSHARRCRYSYSTHYSSIGVYATRVCLRRTISCSSQNMHSLKSDSPAIHRDTIHKTTPDLKRIPASTWATIHIGRIPRLSGRRKEHRTC